MADASRTGRSGGASARVRKQRSRALQGGATEKGYTQKMKRNILGVERQIRTKKDEELHIFNSKGEKLHKMQGKGAGVKFDGYKVPPNSILTHNHPRALNERGIMRIGNSFSPVDILTVVRVNAKEVRAVTPTYTFSMKRPPGGWNATRAEIEKEYKKINRKFRNESKKYLEGSYDISHRNRASVTYYHGIMKELAKKFGWIYTKKNS